LANFAILVNFETVTKANKYRKLTNLANFFAKSGDEVIACLIGTVEVLD